MTSQSLPEGSKPPKRKHSCETGMIQSTQRQLTLHSHNTTNVGNREREVRKNGGGEQMHNCPQGSSKSEICCQIGKRKGQCFQRAYSISPKPGGFGRPLLNQAFRWAFIVPWGLREMLRQQRPRRGLIARRTKRAFSWNHHIISADKQRLQSKYTHVNQHTQEDNRDG